VAQTNLAAAQVATAEGVATTLRDTLEEARRQNRKEASEAVSEKRALLGALEELERERLESSCHALASAAREEAWLQRLHEAECAAANELAAGKRQAEDMICTVERNAAKDRAAVKPPTCPTSPTSPKHANLSDLSGALTHLEHLQRRHEKLHLVTVEAEDRAQHWEERAEKAENGKVSNRMVDEEAGEAQRCIAQWRSIAESRAEELAISREVSVEATAQTNLVASQVAPAEGVAAALRAELEESRRQNCKEAYEAVSENGALLQALEEARLKSSCHALAASVTEEAWMQRLRQAERAATSELAATKREAEDMLCEAKRAVIEDWAAKKQETNSEMYYVVTELDYLKRKHSEELRRATVEAHQSDTRNFLLESKLAARDEDICASTAELEQARARLEIVELTSRKQEQVLRSEFEGELSAAIEVERKALEIEAVATAKRWVKERSKIEKAL